MRTFNHLLLLIYKFWNFLDSFFRKKFLNKIRVRGTVTLHLEDIEFKMYSSYDDGIVDAIYFKERKYDEINEIKLFSALAKESDIIWDVGANTGLYSIIAKKSNPNAQIFAFEPYQINADRFRKNVFLNQMEQEIILMECAVGDTHGKISFAVPENDQICDVLSADTEFTNRFYRKWINYKTIEVQQISLDDFAFQQRVKKVDLIKIDVENYELNVFKGAAEILKNSSPVILVEIFVNEDKIDFFERYFKPLGYHFYIILKDGLVRVDNLCTTSRRTFLFSKRKSDLEYMPFLNMSLIIKQIVKEN